MSVDAQRLFTELGLPASVAEGRKHYIRYHMERRTPPGLNIYTDNQLFFPKDKVYFIDSKGKMDETRIGTILNINEVESEPSYEVEFETVDGSKTRDPRCNQSDLVLRMPGEKMPEARVKGSQAQGGKNRKISKKYRKSKHRKSKYRKLKYRKSKKSN
jgi:hypothetical protein